MDEPGQSPFDVLPTEVGGGRYKLRGQIGVGAVARVVRSDDTERKRAVALKIMPAPKHPDDTMGKRFLEEAEVMARIDHPHIPKVHDRGQEAGWYWFVMDLARDGSLMQHIRRNGPLEVPRALRVAFEICSALHAVHALGLVHRDVKPENVLLDKGHVMLADFGIARHPPGTVPKTVPGQLFGTRGYRAPEQELDSSGVGPESDVYGVAATLFIMLTGSKPKRGLGSRELPESIPADIAELLRRGASSDREERFGTAQDLARALAHAAGEPGWMDDFEPPEPETPPLPAERVEAAESTPAASPLGWFKKLFGG